MKRGHMSTAALLPPRERCPYPNKNACWQGRRAQLDTTFSRLFGDINIPPVCEDHFPRNGKP